MSDDKIDLKKAKENLIKSQFDTASSVVGSVLSAKSAATNALKTTSTAASGMYSSALTSLSSVITKTVESLQEQAKQYDFVTQNPIFDMLNSISSYLKPEEMFKTIFRNDDGITKNVSQFMGLFINGLILSLQMTASLASLSVEYAGKQIGFSQSTSDELDTKYFKIFGDCWINMIVEISKFLNDKASVDFKTMAKQVVADVDGDCDGTLVNNNEQLSFSQILKLNVAICILLSNYYLFKFNQGNSSSDQTDNTGGGVSSDDFNNIITNTKKLEPNGQMKMLIQNNILLYMKITGHKNDETICKKFVNYISTNLDSKLNASSTDSDVAATTPQGDSSITNTEINDNDTAANLENAGLVYSQNDNTKVENSDNLMRNNSVGGKRKTKKARTKKNKKRKTKKHRR